MDSQLIRSRMLFLASRAMLVASTFALTAGNLFAQEEAEVESLSLGKLIADSGIFGWLIILLSVVALAVVIENFVSLKREKLAPPELIDEIQALFDEGQFQEAMELCENEPTYSPIVSTHRLENPGNIPLELIEVQSGTYLGEDDIVRFDDVYGRAGGETPPTAEPAQEPVEVEAAAQQPVAVAPA